MYLINPSITDNHRAKHKTPLKIFHLSQDQITTDELNYYNRNITELTAGK